MDPASLVAMTHASAAYVARYSLKKVTGSVPTITIGGCRRSMAGASRLV